MTVPTWLKVLIVFGIVFGVVLCLSTIPGVTRSGIEKGYTASATERPVLALIAQEATLEAQIHDPSLVKAQHRVTVSQACDLIHELHNPTVTVATFAAEHCKGGMP